MDVTTPPIRDAASIGAFANDLIAHVENVIAAHQPPTQRFAFGSLAVDLSIVGDGFRRRLTTAIDFARLPDAKRRAPAWRIVAIDGAASGVGAPPKLNLEVADAGHPKRVRQRPDRRLMVRYDPGTLTWRVLSLPRRLAAIWTANAARIPEWEDSAPLRDLFHWMTLPTECFLAHAAAIGIGKAGVLLIGPGGSGKSTTTGAAVLRGLAMAGDDFVLIDPRSARAHALYDCIKLNSDSSMWLPDLKAEIVNPVRGPAEKGRIHLCQSRPLAFARSLPIAAAFLPHVVGEPMTKIVPASPSEVARALVPSTLFLIGGGEVEMFRKSTSFLRNLPAFHCNLGIDPFEVIDAMSAFIGDLTK